MEFFLNYAGFQSWVADIDCKEAAQINILRQGLSTELKDSLQHCDIPGDLTEFGKLFSKHNGQI
jgi:hypothetical protein